MTYFNVHALINDIYHNPTAYLNGTNGKANVTYPYSKCSLDGDCVDAEDSIDGYLWYDDLHPNERTDWWVAREFGRVVQGVSEYAEYW